MHKLSLFFLLMCLTSCSFYRSLVPPPPPPPPQYVLHKEEVTRIVQEFAEEMKEEKDLSLEHAYTCYDNSIRTVQLQFISQDLIELCEARELIVDMTERLLAKLNQDPILGPDLSNFPFRPSNLEIYITFESYFGKYVDPMYIMWICMEDNSIYFYTFDLLYSPNRCWHVKHESYPTSREIVVYQREAEQKYEETHKIKPSAFGSERYLPNDSQ